MHGRRRQPRALHRGHPGPWPASGADGGPGWRCGVRLREWPAPRGAIGGTDFPSSPSGWNFLRIGACGSLLWVGACGSFLQNWSLWLLCTTSDARLTLNPKQPRFCLIMKLFFFLFPDLRLCTFSWPVVFLSHTCVRPSTCPRGMCMRACCVFLCICLSLRVCRASQSAPSNAVTPFVYPFWKTVCPPM
jgi:hypothetical protein